jgi:pSer/pThr/pTyr-binding forkhead associated (FHA) protein
VSRRHAAIEWRPVGYCAIDLQSMNGTFVNNTRISEQRLEDGDYLRVGNTDG